MPTARPRKPPSPAGRPRRRRCRSRAMSSAASTRIPARTRALVRVRRRRARRVLPTTAIGRRRAGGRSRTARRAPSRAWRRRGPRCCRRRRARRRPCPRSRSPRRRRVRTFCFTMNVRTGVRSAIPVPERSWTRLPVIRTWPGATREARLRRRRSRRCRAALVRSRVVDDVRVDRRVGADDDPGAARRDLVADDVERAAGRDGAGRDDAAVVRRRAPRCARRGTSRGTPSGRRGRSRAVEPDDDVVLDAQRRRRRGRLSLAEAGVDAAAADEDVAAQRDEAGRRPRARRAEPAAVCRRAVREDDEVLRASRRRTLRSSIAAGRRGAADDREVLDGDARSTAVTVSAVPRATRIVAGPWPRMRSERAPVTSTPSPRS